ncbi:MAG: hypothetical protein IKZ49_04835, partial [Alphaproteobacteria bacterium]|nr:hypothetical protein [Alphaproteobacteria bacterium]
SNEHVTKMDSEVIVATSAGTPGGVVVSRSGSKQITEGGYTFTSYMLDDVKFYAADADTTKDGYLKLGINDDGKIDRMYMVVGGVGANADAGIARDGDDSSTFEAAIFEYVTDSYAKVGDDEFVMPNNLEDITARMKTVIEQRNGLSGGEWEQQPSGDWRYKTGESTYADFVEGGNMISISNNTGAMEQAIQDAYGFDDGKWVTVGENRKYIEYGDEAAYRMVGTNTTTMDDLNATAEELNLDGLHHWNRTDEILPVATYGKDIDGHGTSLQYADFGHFNPVYRTKLVDLNAGNEASGYAGWSNTGETKTHTQSEVDAELALEDYQLFAGGYAISGNSMEANRPSLDPINGQVYKGMAVGRVYTSIHGGGEHKPEILAAYGITSGDGHDISKVFTTYDATMTIGKNGNNVTQTLNMPFNSHAVGTDDNKYYYDVTIRKTGNEIDVVEFGGDETKINSQYQLHGAFDNPANIVSQSFNPGYYGVNTPSEAAGTAAIKANYDTIHDGERDYEVQAAYGMKLQH